MDNFISRLALLLMVVTRYLFKERLTEGEISTTIMIA